MQHYLRYIFSSTKVYYSYVLMLLVGFCAVVVVIAITGSKTSPVSMGQYNSYRCVTGLTAAETFKVMHLDYSRGRLVADFLCQQPSIFSLYSSVDVDWVNRENLSSRAVFDLEYDLILATDAFMARLTPDYGDYYEKILKVTAPMQVYLKDKYAKPSLTEHYFRGKKLGLLSDSYSRSRYQLPRLSLKDAGVSENIYQILYYPSSQALYRALESNEVDVIPILMINDNSQENPYTLLLSDPTRAKWYFFLQKSLVEKPPFCGVAAIVEDSNGRAGVSVEIFDRDRQMMQCGQ